MSEPSSPRDQLAQVISGNLLPREEMAAFVEGVLSQQVSDATLASLLTALHLRQESTEEITGVADALRQRMTRIQSQRRPLLDTCGTGGDRSGTFNISTAAAIVTAAAGQPVAKHGNRKASSRSGSADVLAELGLNIEAELPVVQRCLDELGLTFCFAPLWHGSLKQAAAVRRELPFPTIFNYVGPLANPASASFQVVGVARSNLREKLAGALSRLGTEKSLVVWGTDGLDEVSVSAPTQVSIVTAGGIEETQWTPADFGTSLCDPSSRSALLAETPQRSAEIIRSILTGQTGPAREIVLINAAAALWVCGKVSTLSAGYSAAAEAVDSHAAAELLSQLIAMSHQSNSAST